MRRNYKIRTRIREKRRRQERRILMGCFLTLSLLIAFIIWLIMSLSEPDTNEHLVENLPLSTLPNTSVISVPTATIIVSPTLTPTFLPFSTPTSTPVQVTEVPFTEMASLPTGIRSARLDNLPIYVHINTSDPLWLEALFHMRDQISQVIPVVIADYSTDASVIIEIISPSTVRLECPGSMETIGCGWISGIRDLSTGQLQYTGFVRLRDDATNKKGVLLHEVMHALGIEEHTDDPNDIMYPLQTNTIILSASDIALLQALYPSP